MKNLFFLFVIKFYFSGLVHAGFLINSDGDYLTDNYNFEDFEGFADGYYRELNFEGGKFETRGPYSYRIYSGWTDYNGDSGKAFSNWKSGDPYILRFDESVKAFNMTFSGIGSDWNFYIYSEQAKLLNTLRLFDVWQDTTEDTDLISIGYEGDEFSYIVFDPVRDNAMWDNLKFVFSSSVEDESNTVSEPRISYLFLLSLIVFICSRGFISHRH